LPRVETAGTAGGGGGGVTGPPPTTDTAAACTTPRTAKTRRLKRASKAAVYAFADPLSKATRSLNLSKLARSEFDWRTLTAIRPTTEFEERFITRLVELERLQVPSNTRSPICWIFSNKIKISII